MNIVTICVPLLVVLVLPCLWAASSFQQCQVDADCQEGSFCELNSICETCVPCRELFNRQQPAGLDKCARTEDDCGTCLPGFHAEDLTVQRRSFKCYPIEQDGSDLELTGRSGIPWSGLFIAGAAFIVVLATLITAFATYHFKRGQPTPPRDETGKLLKAAVNDRLPPPYDQIGLARTSDGYTVVSVHEESLNEATPFGQPWCPEGEPVVYSQADNAANGELLDAFSQAGSTETIPSLWEPRDDDLTINNSYGMLPSRPSSRLTRSLSLDSLAVVRPASVPATRSCCDLSDGIYRHRHVQLSQFRRSGVPESKIELYEPLPPQSFPFIDGMQQQGSQDSGFFQELPSTSHSSNRRRPANDVEVQVAVAFFAKRRRDN